MRVSRLLFTSLLLGFSAMPVAAQECSATSLSHEQCRYDVPALKEGEVTSLLSQGIHFEGQSAVICKNGVANLVKPTCEVVEKTDCKIDETSWIQSGAMCSHARQATPLSDGKSVTLNDSKGQGKITYSCNAGKLTKADSTCYSDSTVVTQTANASAVAAQKIEATANSTQPNFVRHPVVVNGTYSQAQMNGVVQIRTTAEATCLSIKDYIPGSFPDLHFTGNANGKTYLTADCKVSTTLRCDQGIVNRNVPGSYNAQRGEFIDPPLGSKLSAMCTDAGYSRLEDKLSVEREIFSADTYDVALLCSGRQASCSTVDTGESTFQGFDSCSTGTVKTSLIEVNQGETPTNSDYVAQCQAHQFKNLQQVVSGPTLQAQTGQFEYYDATIQCSTYDGSTSASGYPDSCRNGSSNANDGNGPALTVTPRTCDTANVTGYVEAIKNPTTGEYDTLPEDNILANMLCGASGYTSMDNVESSTFFSSSKTFRVTAACAGNSNEDRAQCEATGPCYGKQLSMPTQEPYLELDGKYYLNKCYNKETPAYLCNDCQASPFSFTDKRNGNTCTVQARNKKSGDNYSFSFANSTQNGKVDAQCNNGQTRALGGECYKSCPGGVYVGWNDKNGSKSCSQRVPSGTYIHNQRITLGSSVNNTGSASLRCDGNTGQWKVESGQCKLDCTGSANWGSGFSNNGVNKNGLCRANPGRVSHGKTGNMFTATSGTTGKTAYRCDDGTLKLSSSSCDVECGARTQNWGNYCTARASAMESGARKSFSDSNSSSAPSVSSNPSASIPKGPFSQTARGNVTLSCDDGRTRVDSASCKYATRYVTGNYSSWKVQSTSTTKSPTDSQIAKSPGKYSTQTITTVTKRYQTRRVDLEWSDGSKTYAKTQRKEKEDTQVEYKTLTPPPMETLAVGCLVESDGFDVPTAGGCSGYTLTNTKYVVKFIVGDRVDKQGTYWMDTPSDWDIQWTGDCTGKQAICTLEKQIVGFGIITFKGIDHTAKLRIKHKKTGQTKSFTIKANVSRF